MALYSPKPLASSTAELHRWEVGMTQAVRDGHREERARGPVTDRHDLLRLLTLAGA